MSQPETHERGQRTEEGPPCKLSLRHTHLARSELGTDLPPLGTLTDHGGPSREGCLGALAEVVGRGHAQDGHLQPGVDVDASWQDQQAVGIDSSDVPRDDEVFSNLSESNRDVAA